VGYLDCSAKDDQRDAANSKEVSPRGLRIGSRTEHGYRKYSLSYVSTEIRTANRTLRKEESPSNGYRQSHKKHPEIRLAPKRRLSAGREEKTPDLQSECELSMRYLTKISARVPTDVL
jgi:hypothetical protein